MANVNRVTNMDNLEAAIAKAQATGEAFAIKGVELITAQGEVAMPPKKNERAVIAWQDNLQALAADTKLPKAERQLARETLLSSLAE